MKRIICTLGAAALLVSGLAACTSSGTTSVVGVWGDPGAEEMPSLEFTGDDRTGDYAGTDGCNMIGGSYTVEGSELDLGIMRATLMYCEGVDTWLSRATTATLSGNTLTFQDEAGAEIGTLERAAK